MRLPATYLPDLFVGLEYADSEYKGLTRKARKDRL
jgi:hypothetical protein